MMASKVSSIESYDGNPLIPPCGPLLSDKGLAARLACYPPRPKSPEYVEPHIRLHELYSLGSLHIPTKIGIQIATSIDIFIRRGYVPRNPTLLEARRQWYEGSYPDHDTFSSALGGAIVGISGAGKSRAVERALNFYPQTWTHEYFPGMSGDFTQVLWLKIDVPQTGKAADLAEQLMIALDQALGTNKFEDDLVARSRIGSRMLRRWLRVAQTHYLGILVLDEIQNFFKLDTKKTRKVSNRHGEERPELRIVEDEALKFILTLANTSKIPLLVLGTPDGMAAFETRFSTTQKLLTGGFHLIRHFETPDDLYFSKYMLKELFKYQWFEEKLLLTPDLQNLLHELSGGVQRILTYLWILSQRCALERNGQGLTTADFQCAMDTYLAPLKPALDALKSDDPRKLSRYEDLLPKTASFWRGLNI